MAGRSTTFRQIPSNPIPSMESRSFQSAEQPVWLEKQSVCGRCASSVPAVDLWYKWGNHDWTVDTSGLQPPTVGLHDPQLPDLGLQYLFDNHTLVRTPIRQYVPWVTTPALDPIFPVLSYANCNFLGRLMGPTRLVEQLPSYRTELNLFPNCRWHLAYVKDTSAFSSTISNAANAESLTTLIETSQPISFVDGFDSDYESGGWLLCLVRYFIRSELILTQAVYHIDFHIYAGYELLPENNQYPSSVPSYPLPASNDPQQLPLLNCYDRNTWRLAFNPLVLPPHIIQTRPRGL